MRALEPECRVPLQAASPVLLLLLRDVHGRVRFAALVLEGAAAHKHLLLLGLGRLGVCAGTILEHVMLGTSEFLGGASRGFCSSAV